MSVDRMNFWAEKFLNWISNMLEIKDIDLVDNKLLRKTISDLFDNFGYFDYFGYDPLRKHGFTGYAGVYLSIYSSFGSCSGHSIDNLCEGFTILDKSFSLSIYEKLVRIDRKLGTSETEQLANLLFLTTQSDLIKVC